MKTDFYLVRHARKDQGIGDVPITQAGILQAQATARWLSEVAVQGSISRIVSSPLRRAVLTAAIIAQATGAAISEDVRLRERANWGDVPGQSFDEFVAMWDRCTRERGFAPPIGDSARRAGDRFASCLLDLSAAHPRESIVIVTHGGILTDFLINVIPECKLERFHPNFIQRQSSLISECSITKATCTRGIFELERFAFVDHLKTIGPQPESFMGMKL
ncbi:histidine phosphatase family protein [Paenibacillus lycopersici]|uniref:Histidine phosphatase family protein n=1 Tax=Paenibacillus lycopersici TaxID=2704462 RepID=A0A6C0G0K3_9BACL|nr:histidine phosphatase family protein [Paenibacillus lycopersici]QHT61373.1 histidine phosphatase family protein [Paenibacillus lycopersici]